MDGIGFLSGRGGGIVSGEEILDAFWPPPDTFPFVVSEIGKFFARGAFSPPKFKWVWLVLLLLSEFPVRVDALDLCKVVTDAGCVGLCHCVVLLT